MGIASINGRSARTAAQPVAAARPSPPPVYRPQPAPTRPAPPVYRPQTATPQAKPNPRAGAPPVYRPQPPASRPAPPVYRPAATPQAKPDLRPAAPPVYRPQNVMPRPAAVPPAVVQRMMATASGGSGGNPPSGNPFNNPPQAPSKPRKKNKFKQTHLGVRTNKKKGPPTLAVREFKDREHGRRVHRKNKSAKGFSRDYREEQVQYLPNSGGAGVDEMVSTDTVGQFRNELSAHYNPQQVENAVGKLSEQREHVGLLGWPTGEPERPFGSHPGGLSKSQTDMRRGITAGHGTRDIARATAVKDQFHAAMSTGQPLETVVDRTSTMGLMMTVNNFMVPQPQLEAIDVSQNEKNAFHPMFGQVIDDQEKTENWERMEAAMHNNRERRKMELAQKLMEQGYPQAVPQEMQDALGEKEWEEAYMDRSMQEDPAPDFGPPQTQVNLPATPFTLEDLHNQRIRAVSPPRSLVKPKFKDH